MWIIFHNLFKAYFQFNICISQVVNEMIHTVTQLDSHSDLCIEKHIIKIKTGN